MKLGTSSLRGIKELLVFLGTKGVDEQSVSNLSDGSYINNCFMQIYVIIFIFFKLIIFLATLPGPVYGS